MTTAPLFLVDAVASAAAAYITSKIWARGTLFSAAMSPVIVALVKEGLRKPTEGLHSFGLAIDLNGSRNPWLINPDAPHAQEYEMSALSTEIRDIISRAVLLVLTKTSAQADLQSRPGNKDKAARVEASYDKLS